jgi:lysophospholipase L1-like esterase
MQLPPAPRGPHWIVVLLALLAGGLSGLLLPLSKTAAACTLLSLLALAWPTLGGPVEWTHVLAARLLARPALASMLLSVTSIVALAGGLEICAQIATRAGWVRTWEPMRTLLPAGVEDWRLAHITADSYREPDPLLLWRSRPVPPYTSQRFKGPVAERPRPAGVLRVMAYGDSNTDGPLHGGWPERLQAALARHGAPRPEVLNAGVMGYTTHQGLLRFRSEVADFQPSLLLVSFGWNDAAPAVGPPDSGFVVPPPWQLGLIRRLLRYRSYLVLRQVLAERKAARGLGTSSGPRVPLPDYVADLRGFAETARGAGAQVFFLTRPTRASDSELEALAGSWRAQVPAYSRAVIDVGRHLGVPVLDARGWFGGRPDLFVDECHFNDAGHALMAEHIVTALAAAAPREGFR